jgi:cell division protein FtsB
MSATGASMSRVRISPRAAGLAAIVIVLLIASIVPIRQYLAQRAEIEGMQQRIEQLEAQRQRLEGRIEQLHDPEYLERMARECLGMVKPGEIAFATVPEDGKGRPPAC